MSIIKLCASLALAVVMVANAPIVLTKVNYHKPVTVVATAQPLSERVTTTEEKLNAITRELQEHERAQDAIHLEDRMARIEARQEAVLMLLSPVALFIFTHTIEMIWKNVQAARCRVQQVVYVHDKESQDAYQEAQR